MVVVVVEGMVVKGRVMVVMVEVMVAELVMTCLFLVNRNRGV